MLAKFFAAAPLMRAAVAMAPSLSAAAAAAAGHAS